MTRRVQADARWSFRASFVKVIKTENSLYLMRQIGHIFIWLFFIILRRTISSRSGSHKLRNTLYIQSDQKLYSIILHLINGYLFKKSLVSKNWSGPWYSGANFFLVCRILLGTCNKFAEKLLDAIVLSKRNIFSTVFILTSQIIKK